MEIITRMTLEGIAAEIGISRTTIYKVLKNKGNVSDKTKATVMEALEKYRYVENKNARNLALNRQYAIGYVGFRSRSANYFSPEVRKGINEAVKEFGDDGLHILVAEVDLEEPWRQLEEVESMLAQGVRSFLLALSDEKAVTEKILRRLKEEECLIALLSRDSEKISGNYYVGVDYYRSGLLAAELLGKMLPRIPSGGDFGGNGLETAKIFVPVTTEYRSNQDIHARLNGFLEKLKEFPGCQALPIAYGLVEDEEIYQVVTSCVRSEPDLRGIFDLTYRLDLMAKALRDCSRRDIRLVGFDLFPEIEGDIADSVIDAVVYQDLSRQAYLGIKLLFEEMCYGISGEKKKFYSKLEIITSENLCYFTEQKLK
ncbi:MAG: substrate-binding domain-containing protein [Clostridium sp.]|nr:substrate-binding domain-containing protein [Clostridium sp.]